jgi:hypothetical protein
MSSVDDEDFNTKDMATMAAMAVYGLSDDDMYEAAAFVDMPEPVADVASASMGSADGSGLRCVPTRH